MEINIDNIIENYKTEEIKNYLDNGGKLSKDDIRKIADSHKKKILDKTYYYGNYLCHELNDTSVETIRNYIIDYNSSFIDSKRINEDFIKEIANNDICLAAHIILNNFDKFKNHFIVLIESKKQIYFIENIIKFIRNDNFCSETKFKFNNHLDNLNMFLNNDNFIENCDLSEFLIFAFSKLSSSDKIEDNLLVEKLKKNKVNNYNEENIIILIRNGFLNCLNYIFSSKNIKLNHNMFKEYILYQSNNEFLEEFKDVNDNDAKETSETLNLDNFIKDYKISKEEYKLVIEKECKSLFEYISDKYPVLMDNDLCNSFINHFSKKYFSKEQYGKIFSNINFNNTLLLNAIKNKNTNLVQYIFESEKIKINSQYFNFILEVFLNRKNSKFFVVLLDKNKNISLNEKQIDLILKNKNINFIKYLINSNKLQFDNKILELYLDSEVNFKEILQILEKQGEINAEYLALAIKYKNINLIKYLVNEKKLYVMKNAFLIIVNTLKK